MLQIASPLRLVFLVSMLVLLGSQALARPNASVKFSTIRDENPRQQKETLILPYGFSSETMGITYGVGGLAKGYHQDQLLFGGTVFGSSDGAKGVIGGMWDYRLPFSNRLFFTAYGAISYFPAQRAYAEVPRRPSTSRPPPAGSNDSTEENFIEDDGDDHWVQFKLEYVLPIGSMRNDSMARYRLQDGLLKEGATGGREWNPLTSGITVLLLGQRSRYQDYRTDTVTYSGDVFPFEFGIFYNNTDFPTNPSYGSSQYLAYTHDFSDGVNGSWSFIEFEASKYFDLGQSRFARQQVLALNLWTGMSPSWDKETNDDGTEVVTHAPPFLEGARLGGFYRMRGYPSDRFNDRSVLYTTAEYRHTLKWNPIADVNWLRWLKADWFQLVGFVEGGRVAREYSFSELFSDWKLDGGIGIRALLAGTVVRLDMAGSDEGFNAWVMFAHPF